MFIRALFAFLALPGLVAFVVPFVIGYYDPWRGDWWWPGCIATCSGLFILLLCVRDFFVAGKGTLAPWEPPKHLVVVGLYRFVRNPMYVAVVLLVLGWALAFESWLLVAYAGLLCGAFHFRVTLHEEPWLSTTFTTQWSEYEQNVNRWLPRSSPWKSNG